MAAESGNHQVREPQSRPQHYGALSSAMPAEEEELEWEYEYSATEVETFYVTLDLSHPDFLPQRDEDIVANTRGGFKPWASASAKTSKASNEHPSQPTDPPSPADAEMAGEEEDEEEEVEARIWDTQSQGGESDNADDPTNPAKRRRQRGHRGQTSGSNSARKGVDSDVNDGDRSREIQILDFHSPNPIINYNGMIFSGSWAENIGSEMLFTAQRPSHQLPVLRELPQGVDLLAISAARLQCRETGLRPRRDTAARQRDQYRGIRREHGLEIGIMSDTRGVRKPQARFLENLMALKKARGETDEATVHTLDPYYEARMEAGPDSNPSAATTAAASPANSIATPARRTNMRGPNMPATRRHRTPARSSNRPSGRGFKRQWAVMEAAQPLVHNPEVSESTPNQWQELAEATRRNKTALMRGQGQSTDELEQGPSDARVDRA